MIDRIFLQSAILCAASILTGCSPKTTVESVSPAFRLELYTIAPSQSPTTKTMTDLEYQEDVFLQLPPVFSTGDIATLEVTHEATDRNRVVVNPTPAGLAKLKAATSGNSGQHIGFVLNGGLQHVVYFDSPVTGQFTLNGYPTGIFSDGALDRVVTR